MMQMSRAFINIINNNMLLPQTPEITIPDLPITIPEFPTIDMERYRLETEQRCRQQLNEQNLMASIMASSSSFASLVLSTFSNQLQSDKTNPKDKIERKALLLLYKKIGRKKYKQLKKQGYFEEQGKYGIYRFEYNSSGGVTLIEKKKYGNKNRTLSWKLCIQTTLNNLPKGDVILSRWLEFKADEENFVSTANFRSVDTIDEALISR